VRKKGFSLMEVIVAFAILCVAILFLLSSIPLMTMGLKNSENIKGATLVGSDILERIRNAPFGTLHVNWHMYKGEQSFTGASNGIAYTATYIYQTEVTSTSVDTQAQSLYNVLVTVSWEERGKLKKMDLQTIIYNSEGE
jgi:prepilin-type N-terminal cleavage/methylation domain-containing protein